jgi:hypothetical protein
MKIFYDVALVGHIISGMTALFSGMVAIIAVKGSPIHFKAGKTYFFSMIGVAVTAIFISILKSNSFLLHIGIFSFFMVFSGYRSVKIKSLRPELLDWLVLITGMINGVLMIYSLNVVLMVFGGIGFFLAFSDFKIFLKVIRNKSIPANQWLLRHLGMMLGGYISTFTAFIVVNISLQQYSWIPWLAPTIIGTPLIAYWTRKYSLKNRAIK